MSTSSSPRSFRSARQVAREAPGQQRGRLLAGGPGGPLAESSTPRRPGRHEARDLALGVRGVGREVEASGASSGPLATTVTWTSSSPTWVITRLGRDRDLGIERAVVDEAAGLDRELARLQEDLAALAHLQAAEGRGIARVAADAQAAARLQLRQVVADEDRPVGHGREVERDRLQQARLASAAGGTLGARQRLLQADVGVVQPALGVDVAGEQQRARRCPSA